MELCEDDLFTLAGSLSELLDAPVTIEDQDTTVVAYSGGAQAVDDARIGTILGRQVPPEYRQMLADAGVFDRIRREAGVVYVDLGDEYMTPRAVIAVRDGDEFLGSIWAAVDASPSAHQESMLRSAAPVVARLMVHERDRADAARRRSAESLRVVVAGGTEGSRVADDLGLRGAVTVAAVAPVGVDGSVSSRLLGAVRLHVGAVSPHAVVDELDGRVYVVLSADESATRRILTDFLGRARASRAATSPALAAGVGRCVESAAQADRSRADADLALSAVQHAGRTDVAVGVADVLAEVLALHVGDLLDEIGSLSPLTTLQQFDRAHHGELVPSARAYLAHRGDVADAAAFLHVHPNTLRNRLRRASRSCGVDLDDVDTRLVLAMHLKVLDLRGPDSSAPDSSAR